jgi:hypothetical protein
MAAAKSSTIGRRAAAIGYRHKMAGHEPPTNQEGVRAVPRGIRRTIGAAREGKAPATADVLKQMLAPRYARRQAGPGTSQARSIAAKLCALEVTDLGCAC